MTSPIWARTKWLVPVYRPHTEGHLVFSTMTVFGESASRRLPSSQAVNSGLESVSSRSPSYIEKGPDCRPLSGGEQQMLSIGRTLMSKPKLTHGGRTFLRPWLQSDKRDLQHSARSERKRGYPILLSEQNAKKALEFGDRAYVMETGRVLFQGPGKGTNGQSESAPCLFWRQCVARLKLRRRRAMEIFVAQLLNAYPG